VAAALRAPSSRSPRVGTPLSVRPSYGVPASAQKQDTGMTKGIHALLLAVAVPAWRVTRLDPAAVLKEE